MPLLDLFQDVQRFLSPPKVNIDNTVFWLQHRVTVAIFVVFGILSTAITFFGKPIQCLSRGRQNMEVINNYCWVTGTYTIKELTMDQAGAAHPGVGTFDYKNHTKIYHVYYQWICFGIFFQMILFLLPRLLWKNLEAGRMISIVGDMKNEVDGEELDKRVDKLMKAFRTQTNKNYFYKFVLCEILNLVNICLQFILTDQFLGGLFKYYGLEYVNYYTSYHGENTIDPFKLVFPKVAKCDFSNHGPGGDIIDHDMLCVLPLNIINEKIYLLMWFWLLLLAFINICNLLHRILVISLPSLTNWSLRFHNIDYAGPNARLKHRLFMQSLGPHDVFILELFSKNIHEKTFRNMLGRMLAHQNVEKYTTNGSFNGGIGVNCNIKTRQMMCDKMYNNEGINKTRNGNVGLNKMRLMSNGDGKLNMSDAGTNGKIKLNKRKIGDVYAKIHTFFKDSNEAIDVAGSAMNKKNADDNNVGHPNGLEQDIYIV